jgi:hypothetical protein
VADAKPLAEALEALRLRLEDEEASYAAALAELDQKAALPLPEETGPEVLELVSELNQLWTAAEAPRGGGLGKAIERRAWDALAPALERQARFNAVLVRLVNAQLEHAARYHARQRELGTALVRFAQRVEPVVDARDDMRVARTPTETVQVLEAFARRLEAMGERLSGLLALRDRTEALSEEVRALRQGLAAEPPPPETARAAARSAEDSAYTAFENRFRGSREEVRRRQADYAALLRGHAPVLDLGCGRELLELLRAAGPAAWNQRERGPGVSRGPRRAKATRGVPRGQKGATGAVFAAQVAST